MATQQTARFDATAAELAAELGVSHVGPNARVTDVAALSSATSRDLAFSTYDDPDAVADSAAGVVVTYPHVSVPDDSTVIPSDDPKRDFVRLLRERVDGAVARGVHPSATVSPGAELGEDCAVGPGAVVGSRVSLGDRVVVGSNCVLGGPGFGFVEDDGPVRQPHLGRVRIEDDVELGANCTVDRAPFDETVVGEQAKLSSGVHVAHGAAVGAETTVAFGSGVAGGAVVGERVTVHPNVSVATDVSVGDRAELGMGSAVLDDVPAGARVAGSPARPIGGER